MKLFADDYTMSTYSEMLWRLAFNSYYKVFYNLKIFNRDRVPMKGAYIIAPNHMSMNDPPLMGLAMPRPVYFMAKAELFQKNELFSAAIRWLGSFPVNRGGIDKIAIRRSMNLIKRGDLLGIFPQGGRRKPGSFDKLHDGAASIALRTGTAIIPVAIIGTDNLKRNKLAVNIGHPMYVEKAKPTREAIQSVNARLSAELQKLYEEGQRKLNII